MDEASPPDLLLVESDLHAANLIGEMLRDYFGSQSLHHCQSIQETLAYDLNEVDLALVALELPDGTGLELLNALLDRRPDLPLVMLTGMNTLHDAIAAIRLGAADYIIKAGTYLFTVPLVVEKNLALSWTQRENRRLQDQLRRMLEEVRVKNQQLEEMVSQLEAMAATDPLTGLANRRAFNDAIDRCFAAAQRYGHDLACLMIDLDGFKQLNDSFGHQMGDRLLQLAGRVLHANCRRSDFAARYGGDEFIVLLPQTDEATARQVAKRIRAEFSQAAQAELDRQGYDRRLTMSMGLATLSRTRAATPEQFIACADVALYRAKTVGKTCLVIYVDQPPPRHRSQTASWLMPGQPLPRVGGG